MYNLFFIKWRITVATMGIWRMRAVIFRHTEKCYAGQ